MNKVYIVIVDYINEGGSGLNMMAYKDYTTANKQFELEKENIKSFDLGYNKIEDKLNCYCEYEDGYYSSFHDSVYIQELEVK